MINEVWPIELGAAVGPFRLGDSIAEVLHALKSRLPVRPFEIIYDAADPYHGANVIESSEDGLRLHIDAVRQVLVKIEFYVVNNVPLKYGRVVIFGGDIPATFMSIYNLFGPTFPGQYDAENKSYALTYEGASFTFPIPAEYSHLYQNKTDLPLEFPNGKTPAACAFQVFVGDNPRAPQMPQPARRHYFEEVEVEISETNIVALNFKGRKQQIELGWTPQEVMSEIGAPVSVFRKSEDHDDGSSVAGGTVGDYFHNYPHLGLDIMYDALHAATKVILKTNALGHPDFGAYQKCNFRLCFLTSAALQKSGVKKTRIPAISPETPWKDIQKMFGSSSDQRPLVHDDGLGLHPFGSSLCYTPIPGCTFEVLKNGYIASVALSIA